MTGLEQSKFVFQDIHVRYATKHLFGPVVSWENEKMEEHVLTTQTMAKDLHTGRIRTIDVCRGLLFVFMINTHALSLASVPSSHWLFSDLWLPNGWATQVFVVLSGYGVGFLFSIRPSIEERNAALRRRSRQILAVMLVSNVVFAALREIVAGHGTVIASTRWWIGFVSLSTDWTISGVLLPTALVLLCGPAMILWTQRCPWQTLTALTTASLLTSVAVIAVNDSPFRVIWLARFFLLEGLAGFPVLPFVLNGCLGIWLGVQKHRNPGVWRRAIVVLMAFQLFIYLSTLAPVVVALQPFVMAVRAGGKFAWMLAISQLLVLHFHRRLIGPIDLFGSFALGSFVMHRVFLQSLEIGLRRGSGGVPPEIHYLILFLGALTLTWLLCVLRQQVSWMDRLFRRLAL